MDGAPGEPGKPLMVEMGRLTCEEVRGQPDRGHPGPLRRRAVPVRVREMIRPTIETLHSDGRLGLSSGGP